MPATAGPAPCPEGLRLPLEGVQRLMREYCDGWPVPADAAVAVAVATASELGGGRQVGLGRGGGRAAWHHLPFL